MFSAKECLYKALYEHVGEYFGFHKAKVVSITDTDLEIEVQEDLSDRVKKAFVSLVNMNLIWVLLEPLLWNKKKKVYLLLFSEQHHQVFCNN